MSEARSSFGVDLGTTHTVVARHGTVRQVSASELGPQHLLASVVAYPPNGRTLVGWPARARRAVDPRHTLLSTKRLIGARPNDYRSTRFAERHPYDVVSDGDRAVIRTRAGDVDPAEVAADILKEATGNAGCDPAVSTTVITVPAAFETNEREATLQAARLASFANPTLIEEPVATAIAYLSRSNLRYAVVYDLGGGTFDIAVVDCSQEPFAVVAHAGDPYLGGDDIDRELALRVHERVLRERRWDLKSDAEVFARLIGECEKAKIALSDVEESPVDLVGVDPAGPWTEQAYRMERRELDEITQALVRRTFGLCDEVLGSASLAAKDIQAVFLAGGSTALPGLRSMVGEYFGKRVRADIDPMSVVAIGASLAAARPGLGAFLNTQSR